MKVILLFTIVVINICYCLSSPLSSHDAAMSLLSRVRRHASGGSDGSGGNQTPDTPDQPPAQHHHHHHHHHDSQHSSKKIKVTSNVDNKSDAESSILDVDVGTGVGVGVDVETSLANGILSGGISENPLVNQGALNVGNLLGGLLSAQGGGGHHGGHHGGSHKGVIGHIIEDVEADTAPAAIAPLAAVSVPASASIGNPLGTNLGEVPPHILEGLSSVLGNIFDSSSSQTV